MNLDAIFDDLSSEFDRLQGEAQKLANFSVVGYSNVSFGRGHFVGISEETGQLTIVPFVAEFRLSAGESRQEKTTLASRCDRLIGEWLTISTVSATLVGRLTSVERGLLIFRNLAVPIAAVRSIRIGAVDN